MISVDEARLRILEQASPLEPQPCELVDAFGRVVATTIQSDIDSPPHDKSLVDGYAVRLQDLAEPSVTLTVVEEVTAGRVPTQPLAPGGCTRIMTGAPLPALADGVVMVEDSELLEHDGNGPERVRITAPRLTPGQHIMRRGASMQKGDPILQSGHRLRPVDLGLLAESGVVRPRVYPPARVAILATGDELVPCDEVPGPGQIRNSNSVLLESLVQRAGATPVGLGIALDRRDHLLELVQRGLESDVLVLSGGVSAGVLDLVPAVLAELGVERIFHKIQLKPGKPLWFGVLDQPPRKRLVFGLPGNPVGSLVCFALLVQPALRKLSGHTDLSPPTRRGQLQVPFRHRGSRPTYFPARVTERDERLLVETLPWKGSADMRTLADASALVHFPAGNHDYAAGDTVQIFDVL